MKNANTTTLFDLIDSADANGMIHVFAPLSEPMRSRSHAREWLLTVFMDSLAELRLDRLKKAITEIDLSISHNDQFHVLTVNLAKVLNLPGHNPAEELQDFKKLCFIMKDIHEAHPTDKSGIQICNNRNRNGRVYGTIKCMVPNPDDKHHFMVDKAWTDKLTALIESSQGLQHWLRAMAMLLQRLGPWSWYWVRAEDLFGYGNTPATLYWLSTYSSTPPPANPEPLIPLDI